MAECIRAEVAHRGRLFSVEVLSWAGDDGRPVVREVVRHPGAVLVVAELPDARLLLVRNFRVAVGERLWELPAGTMEPGEAPAATAARELEEETGYRARRMEPLATFYTSPGFCDERMEVFGARDLVHVGQRLEAHEEIEVVPVDRAEALAMVDDGRIRDGKTIAALLLLARSGGGGAA